MSEVRKVGKSRKTNWKKVGAPYVEPLKEMLGDTHLDPQESVIREREELLKVAAKSKIDGQDELEKQERSAGSRLYYTDILRRLHKLNPGIKILDGIEGNVAIYRSKLRHEYDESERDRSKADFFWDHVYVTGMLKDWLPEYAHVLLDSSHLPTKEIRGWRSVLIALVKAKAITYAQAVEEFGDPFWDSRSTRWFEQLNQFQK
jgi:hypothetical protein